MSHHLTEAVAEGHTRTVAHRPPWRTWTLAATCALATYGAAVSWQAQVVSYPLYRTVPAEAFPAYHLAYNAAIPGVVVFPGFLGFAACIAFWWTRPTEVPRWLAGIVAATGLGAIATTVLWAIPLHDHLDRVGQDSATITGLLQANAVRTAVLTVGAAALTAALARLALGSRSSR